MRVHLPGGAPVLGAVQPAAGPGHRPRPLVARLPLRRPGWLRGRSDPHPARPLARPWLRRSRPDAGPPLAVRGRVRGAVPGRDRGGRRVHPGRRAGPDARRARRDPRPPGGSAHGGLERLGPDPADPPRAGRRPAAGRLGRGSAAAVAGSASAPRPSLPSPPIGQLVLVEDDEPERLGGRHPDPGPRLGRPLAQLHGRARRVSRSGWHGRGAPRPCARRSPRRRPTRSAFSVQNRYSRRTLCGTGPRATSQGNAIGLRAAG